MNDLTMSMEETILLSPPEKLIGFA